jgi:hypothetical protein
MGVAISVLPLHALMAQTGTTLPCFTFLHPVIYISVFFSCGNNRSKESKRKLHHILRDLQPIIISTTMFETEGHVADPLLI